MWQPIETAPKDGHLDPETWDYRLLLGADASGRVFPMYWKDAVYGDKSQASWWAANTDEEYGGPLTPTHWMPLPEPPGC